MTDSPPRPWYVRHWALLTLVVLLAGHNGIVRWDAYWERERLLSKSSIEFAVTTAPPPTHIVNATTHNGGKTFEATHDPAWLEWIREPSEAEPRFVQLVVKPISSCDWQKCYLQYVSADDRNQNYDDVLLRERTVRPIVRLRQDDVMLDWHLLRPAQRLRILLPSGANFTITSTSFNAGSFDQFRAESGHEALHLILTCVSLGLLMCWLAQFTRLLDRTLARPIVVGGILVGVHGVMMVWLLPPFQGPDENRHWKAAIGMFLPDAPPALRDLPDYLGALDPRWRCEVPFPAQTLRSSARRYLNEGEQSGVGYAGPWAYPVIGLVSVFFPRVQTLNDALIFYYCCRLVPLVVLLFLLAALWRRGLASWTLVTFLSLPLVMQQMLVVSTDTIPNLGTLAALLLFDQPRRRWTLLALTLITVLVVLAKPPIYAVLLVLPAWYLPWSHMWRWQIMVPAGLAGIAVVVGGYFALWSVVDRTDDALASHAQKQLQFLLTAEGLESFGIGLLEYPSRFLNPEYWWAPLGWLDTPLSDLHKNLLWASLLLAVAFDLARGWRRLLRHWQPALEGLGLAVLHGLFTWISLGAVMYLTITEYRAAHINGMQVRYMIPVVLLALILPVILMKRAEPEQPANPTRPWWVLAHGTLLALAIVRAIQLAGDLQYRYWG